MKLVEKKFKISCVEHERLVRHHFYVEQKQFDAITQLVISGQYNSASSFVRIAISDLFKKIGNGADEK